jgi:hypothetical protein
MHDPHPYDTKRTYGNNTPRSHLRDRRGHGPRRGTPRGVSVRPRQQDPPAGGGPLHGGRAGGARRAAAPSGARPGAGTHLRSESTQIHTHSQASVPPTAWRAGEAHPASAGRAPPPNPSKHEGRGMTNTDKSCGPRGPRGFTECGKDSREMHGGTTTQPQDIGEGRHWDGKLPENTPSSYYPNDAILAHSRGETSRRKELADFVSRCSWERST